MARSNRTGLALAAGAFAALALAGYAADQTPTPCSLLSPAEIQAALGKPVQAGKLKTQPIAASGSDCTWVVGGFGSFNFLIKPLSSYETPERIKAEFAKRKMNPVDLPRVGDCSFFTSPGFGMVQLHTMKAGRYLLFTLLVPGLQEPALRTAAAQLMGTVLGRLK